MLIENHFVFDLNKGAGAPLAKPHVQGLAPDGHLMGGRDQHTIGHQCGHAQQHIAQAQTPPPVRARLAKLSVSV